MKTKNSIKAKSNSRGQGKLGYTESSRMVSVLKRKAMARFSEDEANEVPTKAKKKKQKLGYAWRSIIKAHPTAQLIKSCEYRGHNFRTGDKVTWDGNNFIVNDKNKSENCFISREGWLYNVIKFMATITDGAGRKSVLVVMNKSYHRFGGGSSNPITTFKNFRPWDHNPVTIHGTYKDIEQDFDEAMEFFAEFPGVESEMVDYKKRTKKEYKAYAKYYNKAK